MDEYERQRHLNLFVTSLAAMAVHAERLADLDLDDQDREYLTRCFQAIDRREYKLADPIDTAWAAWAGEDSYAIITEDEQELRERIATLEGNLETMVKMCVTWKTEVLKHKQKAKALRKQLREQQFERAAARPSRRGRLFT